MHSPTLPSGQVTNVPNQAEEEGHPEDGTERTNVTQSSDMFKPGTLLL